MEMATYDFNYFNTYFNAKNVQTHRLINFKLGFLSLSFTRPLQQSMNNASKTWSSLFLHRVDVELFELGSVG